jgi:hypothetical protein
MIKEKWTAEGLHVSSDFPGDLYVCLVHSNKTSPKEIVANCCSLATAYDRARLIAAAPDLLFAALDAIKDIEEFCKMTGHDQETTLSYLDLKSAIARAKGSGFPLK